MKRILFSLVLTGVLLLGAQSSAVAATVGDLIDKYINTGTCTTTEIAGIFCILVKVINMLLGLGGGLALVFLIYGGLLYMLSGGDQKQLATAKNAITYSVLGLILILGAVLAMNTLLGAILK